MLQSSTSTTTIDVTSTFIAQPIQTNVCDFDKFPQACAHYSSVISRNDGSIIPMDTLYCPLSTMANRKLPKKWDDQHDKNWRSWISSLPKAWGSNTCERDEYPPMRFMAKDQAQQYTQWMRFLPHRDNNGAGKLWANKCGKAKSQTKVEGGPINNRLCTEYKSHLYTVTAFSLRFDNTGQASGSLASNPCFPSMLSDDPGYALMTQDKWYGEHLLAGYHPEDWADAPAPGVTMGLTKPKNQPKRWLDEGAQADDWQDLAPTVHEILSQRPPSYYPPTETLPVDPEDMVVDEGNSTRKLTAQELWDEFGLYKCQREGCPDERQAAGLLLEREEVERLAHATADVVVSATTVPGRSIPTASAPTPTVESPKDFHPMVTSAAPAPTIVQ